MTYKIIRMYRDDFDKNMVIKTGLTLKEAQEHCQREDTQGVDDLGDVVWFDGYYRE